MRILSKLFLSLCISFIITSCENDNESMPMGSKPNMSISKSKMDTLLINAINYGDFLAYNELSNYYFIKDDFTDFYYYAFIMANKHNNAKAYYDLYFFLTNESTVNGVELFSSDSKIQNTAMYYLMKSYELNYDWDHDKPIYSIEEIFGEGNEFPTSNYYLNLIAGDTLIDSTQNKLPE